MFDLSHPLPRPLLVDALEREQLEPLPLDRPAGVLAGVEGDLVTALAQRVRDAQLRQQMTGERPQRDQEAAAHRAVSTVGAGSLAFVRRSTRRMCPPK